MTARKEYPYSIEQERVPEGWILRGEWTDGRRSISKDTWKTERGVIVAQRTPRKIKWRMQDD